MRLVNTSNTESLVMPLCLINSIRLSFIGERQRHAVELTKENIVFTSGVLTSLAAAVQTFTKPGDSILIHDPVYPPFFFYYRNKSTSHCSKLFARKKIIILSWTFLTWRKK